MTQENNKTLQSFITEVKKAFEEKSLIKITISKNRDKTSMLKKIQIQPILLREEEVFSVVYTNKTQDITKNYTLDELCELIEKLLVEECKNAVLFTKKSDITLSANSKNKFFITETKASLQQEDDILRAHDKHKEKLLSGNEEFLKLLKVVSSTWEIIKSKVGKFKQINKFLEVLNNAINKAEFKKWQELKMLDMWSGKGYLTFASYNFLLKWLWYQPQVRWVEWRKDMVELCNNFSDQLKFDWLNFVQGSIWDYKAEGNDILVALHACDTATDDAIHKWIITESSVIILSPCCHKQIRQELNISDELLEITSSWILKERLAEMVTDTLRKMYLEMYWYSVQIFEFVPDSYTHKNLMIVAIKSSSSKINKWKQQEKIENFKKKFWIKTFYLEEVLR